MMIKKLEDKKYLRDIVSLGQNPMVVNSLSLSKVGRQNVATWLLGYKLMLSYLNQDSFIAQRKRFLSELFNKYSAE